ncbi:hypothetical protein HDU67_000513 [Dinochytrium kinnereticum]|nr:hypothetical protein HDU67_000513 [Dinochytrium kinnereticum]
MASGSCQNFPPRSRLLGPPPDPELANTSRAACAENCGSSSRNNGNPYPFAGITSESAEDPVCVCVREQSTTPGQCQTCARVGPCGIISEAAGLNLFVFSTSTGAVVIVDPAPSPSPTITSVSVSSPGPVPPISLVSTDSQLQPGPSPVTTEPPGPDPVGGETSMVVITGMDGSVVTTSVVNSLSNGITSQGSQLVSGPSTITRTSIGSDGVPTVFVVTQVATIGINDGGGPSLNPNGSAGEGTASTSKPSSVATVGAAIGGVFGFAAFAAVALVVIFRRRRRRIKKSGEANLYRRAAVERPNPRDDPDVSRPQLEKFVITTKDENGLPQKPEAAVSIYGSATRFERSMVNPKVSYGDKETKASLFDGIETSRFAEEELTTMNRPFEKKGIGLDGFPVPSPGKKEFASMSHLPQSSAQGSSLMGRSQTSLTRKETDAAPPPYAAD